MVYVATFPYDPSTRGDPTVLEQANGRNRDFEGRLVRYCEPNYPSLSASKPLSFQFDDRNVRQAFVRSNGKAEEVDDAVGASSRTYPCFISPATTILTRAAGSHERTVVKSGFGSTNPEESSVGVMPK